MPQLKRAFSRSCALVFSVIYTSLVAAQSMTVSGNSDIFGDYYSFLAHISAEPQDRQIDKLKSYIEAHPEFERPYHQLLTLYLDNNQPEEAELFFKMNLQQPSWTRNSTWALAALAATRDSSEVAFNLLKEALKMPSPTPYLLLELAGYFHSLSKPTTFENELTDLQLSPRNRAIALAFYHSSLGQFEQCRHYLDQIQADDEFELYALHMSAYIEQTRGQTSNAEALFRQGMTKAKDFADEQFYIQYLLSVAHFFYNSRRHSDSMQYYEDVLQRASNIRDIDRMITAHIMLADMYHDKRELDTALRHIQTADDLASRQVHKKSLANIYWIFGSIHEELAHYIKALEYYNKSIDYAKKSRDTKMQIFALRSKGDLYVKLNLFHLADHEFINAVQLADSSGNSIYLNETIINWAGQLGEMGELQKSREMLSKAISSGQLGIERIVYAYFHLASGYEDEKNFRAALTTYEKVCDLADEYHQNQQLQYYKAVALPQRAAIEARFGNFSRAESLLADPLIQEKMKSRPPLQMDYFLSLAFVSLHKNDFDNAIKNYQTAATLIDNYREDIGVEHFRIGFFQQTSDVYQKLVLSHYERFRKDGDAADLASIFNSLQKSSGRSLQDRTRVRADIDYSPHYISAIDSLHFLQRRLRDSVWKKDSLMTAELRTQHDVARHALLNQRSLILDKAPLSKPKEISLGNVQKVCADNDLNVLLYHISDSLSFALVVQPDSLMLVPLEIDRLALTTNIITLMAPLHNATRENLATIEFRADIAHELYTIIFKPIQQQISLSKNLVVVPGLSLLNLPFEMLLTKDPAKTSYTPTDSADYAPLFLQHDYAFTYSPSLAPLLNKSSQSADRSLIIFSNPTFYDSDFLASLSDFRAALRSIFMQLPYADEEARRIAETTRSEYVNGNDVTKKAVLKAMKKYDIVHIATHAFVDSVFDAYSGLALATSDEKDDGLLMGYELLDVSLRNDLIVLSACESGGGKFVAGEGVLGLPRLFLRAGVRSVLMSLWKVHDPFPSHLMPTFYEYFINQNKTKSEALALAKRHVLDSDSSSTLNYKHPFFWATFCLYGSPGLKQKIDSRMFILGGGFALFISAALFTFYKRRRRYF